MTSNTKPIKLLNFQLITNNGFGETKDFTSFDKATRYIMRYDLRFWEHADEWVEYHITWENDTTIHSSFSLPSDDSISEINFKNLIQQNLEDKLFFPPEDANDEEVFQLVHNAGYLFEYLSADHHILDMYREILAHGEGLDSTRYARQERKMKRAFARLYTLYPDLLPFCKEIRDYSTFVQQVPARSLYFKDFLSLKGRSFIIQGIIASLKKDKTKFEDCLYAMHFLKNTIQEELRIPDERFTVYGKELYRMLPLDYRQLPQSKAPLTEEQISEIRARFNNIRTARRAQVGSNERDVFYSCYAGALQDVLKLPENKRSHQLISQITYHELQAYNISIKRRLALFEQFDPFAVGIPDYIDKICLDEPEVSSI